MFSACGFAAKKFFVYKAFIKERGKPLVELIMLGSISLSSSGPSFLEGLEFSLEMPLSKRKREREDSSDLRD